LAEAGGTFPYSYSKPDTDTTLTSAHDATEAFEDVGHSDEARALLPGMLVGTFQDTDVWTLRLISDALADSQQKLKIKKGGSTSSTSSSAAAAVETGSKCVSSVNLHSYRLTFVSHLPPHPNCLSFPHSRPELGFLLTQCDVLCSYHPPRRLLCLEILLQCLKQ